MARVCPSGSSDVVRGWFSQLTIALSALTVHNRGCQVSVMIANGSSTAMPASRTHDTVASGTWSYSPQEVLRLRASSAETVVRPAYQAEQSEIASQQADVACLLATNSVASLT